MKWANRVTTTSGNQRPSRQLWQCLENANRNDPWSDGNRANYFPFAICVRACGLYSGRPSCMYQITLTIRQGAFLGFRERRCFPPLQGNAGINCSKRACSAVQLYESCGSFRSSAHVSRCSGNSRQSLWHQLQLLCQTGCYETLWNCKLL